MNSSLKFYIKYSDAGLECEFSSHFFEHKNDYYDVFYYGLSNPTVIDILAADVSFTDCMDSVKENKFLLIIFDKISQELKIAIDRSSSIPVYYNRSGAVLHISHSPQEIITEADLDVAIDDVAVYELVSLLAILPPKTIYKEIKVLPLGSFGSWMSNGESHVERYWNIEKYLSNKETNYETHTAKLRKKLVAYIKNSFNHDSCISLSGGIDSGGILGIVSSLGFNNVHTYTLGAKGENTIDLTEGSRKTVEYFDAKNTEIYPGSENLRVLQNLFTEYPQPVNPYVALNMSLILKKASLDKRAKIFYGNGTQMALGNLKINYFLKKVEIIEKIVPFALLKCAYLLISLLKGYSQTRRRFLLDKSLKSRFFYSQAALYEGEKKIFKKIPESFIEKVMGYGETILSNTELSDTDKITALYCTGWVNYAQVRDFESICSQYSIEPMMPFLDVRYLDQLLGSTDAHRAKNKWNKQVIRDILKPYVPNYLYKMKVRSMIVRYDRLISEYEEVLINYISTSKIILDHFDMHSYRREFHSLPEPWFNLIRLVGLALWYDTHHDPENIRNFDKAIKQK